MVRRGSNILPVMRMVSYMSRELQFLFNPCSDLECVLRLNARLISQEQVSTSYVKLVPGVTTLDLVVVDTGTLRHA